MGVGVILINLIVGFPAVSCVVALGEVTTGLESLNLKLVLLSVILLDDELSGFVGRGVVVVSLLARRRLVLACLEQLDERVVRHVLLGSETDSLLLNVIVALLVLAVEGFLLDRRTLGVWIKVFHVWKAHVATHHRSFSRERNSVLTAGKNHRLLRVSEVGTVFSVPSVAHLVIVRVQSKVHVVEHLFHLVEVLLVGVVVLRILHLLRLVIFLNFYERVFDVRALIYFLNASLRKWLVLSHSV